MSGHYRGSSKVMIGSAQKFLHESTQRNWSAPFQSGFFWLIGYIAILLVIARFIFWTHSWHFSWTPAGLPRVLVFVFGAVHLGIGPSCILICDAIREIGKVRRDVSWRTPRALLRDFAKERYTARYLLHGALAYALVYGTLISYTNLKPAIPLLDHALYDSTLFRWDELLSHVLSLGDEITIPRHPLVTVFFDNLYLHIWTLACITLVISFRDQVSFWRLTAAWCLAFGISIPLSVFFPSLGPAFYKPELYAYMGGTSSAEIMHRLLEQYLSFKADPLGTPITWGNGIAAMPSLHCALAYLTATFLGKQYPSLRFVWCGFLLLFVIATVYLGWHYLSDGIAGILLGWVTYRISTLWFRENRETQIER
ncbi:MAG TPA: phosphatase PAP2 family protein [Geobacteraceae bacterium]